MDILLFRGEAPSYCGIKPKPRGHLIKHCEECQRQRRLYWRAVRKQHINRRSIMTTDNATVNDEVYDPDEPPESSFITDFHGEMKASVQVGPHNIAQQEQHVQKSITDYWDTVGRTPVVWYLEAHGLSVNRTDGQPFRQTDIIAVQDKNGKWLGKKMIPDVVATQYRGLGVSASSNRVGQADSAVGRAFHFQAYEIDFKRGKKSQARPKTISLWPVEIHPVGWKYEGEVTMVEPKSDDDTGAPTSAPAVSAEQVTTILREALAGKKPEEMFDVIMADARLKGVGKVFGVGLMEAATDNSLAGVLAENGVLVVGDDGTLAVPA